MKEILELAARLGKRVAGDPRVSAMTAAHKALADSPEDRQILADYEKQQRKIAELEAAGAPIEPEDKRRVADLHGRVVSSLTLKDLVKAEADYAELMSIVTQRIEQEALTECDAQQKGT